MRSKSLLTKAKKDQDDEFTYWWTVAGQWVEPPNQRRKGWSGMFIANIDGINYYIKRQCNHLCRTLTHPLGWPTASRERHYLDRVRRLGLLVPEFHYHGARRTANGVEAILVTKELIGFESLAEQTGLDPEQRKILAEKLGHQLGLLHRARLQHGCLYDKHLMVRWQAHNTPHIALIDLEKMHHSPTRSMAAKRDLAQLKRHQSIWTSEEWTGLIDAHNIAMHRKHR